VRDLRVLNGSLFNHPFMARLLPGPRLGTAQIVALQMSAMSPLCATSGHQSRLSFNKGAGSRVRHEGRVSGVLGHRLWSSYPETYVD